MPFLESIRFCEIATQIQDTLAISPILDSQHRQYLDGLLVGWYENLPWLLRTEESCAEPLALSRCVAKMRYWNLRMLLHRPALLAAAKDSKGTSVADDELLAARTCQMHAKATIEGISIEWVSNQMSGWNAVWFLYQAVMVPLLSILWQPESPSVADWKQQVETTLGLFESIEDWSLTARRSREVVGRIYEASCRFLCPGVQASVELNDDRAGITEQEFYNWAEGLEMDLMMNMLGQDWPSEMDDNASRLYSFSSASTEDYSAYADQS